jgi:hypothetical protein
LPLDVESYFIMINDDEDEIRRRYLLIRDRSSERARRLFAASEARVFGFGGIEAVARATGIARSTIGRALKELDSQVLPEGAVRRKGGGRHLLAQSDPELLSSLQRIVEPATMGDPMRSLLWVSKSRAKIANALTAMGHSISPNSVGPLLEQIGYRRQVNRKTEEGSHNPDRNAQFEHINDQAQQFMKAEQPVISVDTKKKENIGNFKNAGSDYRPEGRPDMVRVHDFVDKELGKVAPYGVYDLANNTAYVAVGIDHDTAEFAVNSIRSWWRTMGQARYPHAKKLMITADGGGSNGSRVRLWKRELQKLADELGIELAVCHYPPGCSKWNKIEHRLFCQITENWRGKPLISRIAVVDLIASTTTKTGLIVRSQLDERKYQTGTTVTNDEMKAINIRGNNFRPEWNYTIAPSNLE